MSGDTPSPSTWRHLGADSIADHPANPDPDLARVTLAVMVAAAVALTGMNYTKGAVPEAWFSLVSSGDAQLSRLLWWAAASVFWYVAPAVLMARFYLKVNLRRLGLERPHLRRHFRLYLGMLAVMVPLVILVSFNGHFQAVYPFYRQAVTDGLTPAIGVWWIAYGAQFVALEFFFRGYMVHALKPHLGFAAIPAMMVPYAMIHFQKPLLETCGAILAGTALGALSLRTRSIWLGAMLHISVAAAMDLASLAQHGALW